MYFLLSLRVVGETKELDLLFKSRKQVYENYESVELSICTCKPLIILIAAKYIESGLVQKD